MGGLVHLPLVLAPVLEVLTCAAVSREFHFGGMGTPAMIKLSREEKAGIARAMTAKRRQHSIPVISAFLCWLVLP